MEISVTAFVDVFAFLNYDLLSAFCHTRWCTQHFPCYRGFNFVFTFLQVLLVMTDGISQDSVVGSSRALRNTGVRILALGIGRKFRRAQLNQITTNPRYVFNSQFRDLHRVVTSIKRTVCKGK